MHVVKQRTGAGSYSLLSGGRRGRRVAGRLCKRGKRGKGKKNMRAKKRGKEGVADPNLVNIVA